jgi:hypothetical protein
VSARNGKPVQDDPYQERSALIRELREQVADQLHDLVVEREPLGSDTEVVRAIRHVSVTARHVTEAIGRQKQATEMGLPVTPAVRAEREARDTLRHAVMSLGEACGAWVVQMDFEERRPRVESAPTRLEA